MNGARRRVGELRPSQVLFSYGVGALVDLPHISVVVLGLDDWDQLHAPAIAEGRLLDAVRRRLGGQVEALRAPPRPENEPRPGGSPFDEDALTGIAVAPFPRWMVCPRCRLLADLSVGVFEPKLGPTPDSVRYVHAYCSRAQRPDVVPARFLVVCPNGHLDDFPWSWFVHGPGDGCPSELRLAEIGPSGEARDVEVSCVRCEKRRRMAQAFGEDAPQHLPRCRGRRVHLKDLDPQGCEHAAQTILMGASNIWFPDSLNVLSIPVSGHDIDQLVEEHWSGALETVRNAAELGVLLRTDAYRRFTGHAPEDVWEAVQRRRSPAAAAEVLDLKGPEWEVLSVADESRRSRDFQVLRVEAPPGFGDVLDGVVRVERLREVRALVAFSRIDPPADLRESGDAPGRAVPLTRTPPRWVPATEVRGEGIFLRFDEDAVSRWSRSPQVAGLAAAFLRSHVRWRQARGAVPPEEGFPGIRFVLLHSLAHALIRQFSVECGYGAASLRERIYAREPEEDGGPMAGILIYTAAPDSEGTLGGLVRLGEPDELGRHLASALEHAALCSSDPLCAEHEPSTHGRTIHGAACHACLFVSETSCEAGNRYLDRSVLVDTLEKRGIGLFRAGREAAR